MYLIKSSNSFKSGPHIKNSSIYGLFFVTYVGLELCYNKAMGNAENMLQTQEVKLSDRIIGEIIKTEEWDTAESEPQLEKIKSMAAEIGKNRESFWNLLVTFVNKTSYTPPKDRESIVLDVACGSCEEAIVASAFFGGNNFGYPSNNVKFFGIDINPNDIEKAISRYKQADNSKPITEFVPDPHYNFIVGDATQLDKINILPEQVDIILIRHEQISDNKEVWTSIISQALKKISLEGIIIITSFSDVEHSILATTLSNMDCEIVINEKNPHARALSHKEISLDRNVVIIKKSQL